MTETAFFDTLLVVTMIGLAIWMIVVRDVFAAIIGFMAFGLLLSLGWLRIEAPDVGLTEIAVGGGATGVMLLRARGLSRAGDAMNAAPGFAFRVLVALLAGAVALFLAGLVIFPPAVTPTLAPLAAEHLASTGVGNPITAVLMAYRAFDTFLETVVVLLALIGVWSLTPDGAWGGRPKVAAKEVPPPLLLLAQWLVPLGIVIGIYITWVGADEPGGKFQGATILAAMWMLVMMAGLRPAPALSSRRLRIALVVGPAIFIAIGLAGFHFAGAFLAYPDGLAKPLILAIEAGLLISIAAMLGMLLAGPPLEEDHP